MDYDIKLEAAIRWNIRGSFDKLSSIKNEAVRSVFREFDRNLYRVWSFATLLPKMLGLADRYGRAGERVALRSSENERHDPDFMGKSQKKIHAIVDKEEAEIKADKAKGLEEDERILQNIDFILGWYAQPKEDGSRSDLLVAFDSLFQSILINAWSAFEIFSEDLWIAAVDNDASHKFAENYCKQSSAQSKSFTFEQLKAPEFGFDFSRKMGSLLSKTEKVKFDSFSAIKGNYEITFASAEYGRKFKEAFNLSKTDPANVSALESVRNQLMHRGQRADNIFVGQIQRAGGCSLPSITGLKENDTISVDGEMVKTLVESVVSLGGSLTRFVDEALAPADGTEVSSEISGDKEHP